MKKIFLIPLMTLCTCVMAWADNIAQITVGENEPVGYETLSDLQTAIAALPTDGTVATIKLLDDINATSSDFKADGSGRNGIIVVKLNQNVILDLNGHNISGAVSSQDKHLILNTNGKLTIDDSSESTGTIHNTQTGFHDWWRPVYSRSTGDLVDELHLVKCNILSESACGVAVWGYKLIIEEGVTILTKQEAHPGTGVNNSPAIDVASDGVQIVIINGGTFTSVGQAAICLTRGDEHQVTINGGTFSGHVDAGAINGYAPTSGVTINGGRFSSDPYDYLDQAVFSTYEEDGYYKVKQMSSNKNVSVYTFAELKQALESATDADGVNITLQGDIVVNEPVELKHGSALTIPSGKTLSVVDNGLFINEGLTTNNGVINIQGSGYFSNPMNVRGTALMTGEDLTISGDVVNYQIDNAMDLQWLSYLIHKNNDELINHTWNITLNTDITIPNGVMFDPIDEMVANIHGNNHKISGIRVRSNSEYVGIFRIFEGNIKDLTLSAEIQSATGTVGVIAGAYNGGKLENVTVEGSVNMSGQSYGYAGFFGSSEGGAMFVNCVNKANVIGANGMIAGGYLGTISGTTGTIGFYNCENKGNVTSGLYAGALIGYGFGATIDVIAFTNTGTITAPSNGTHWKVGGVNYVGIDSRAHSTTYLDANTYTAVFDDELGQYVAKEAGVIDNTSSSTEEWEKSTTWTDSDDSTPVVPNASDSVTVNNASGVVVNDGIEAEAKIVTVNTTLTVNDGGKLTIGDSLNIKAGATVTVKEGATLVVGEKGITIADGGHLVVEATEDGGTGVVLVDPAATVNTRPEATVELIPDAYKISDEVYKYRYIGIPLYFEASESFDGETNWTKDFVDPDDTGSKTTYLKQWKNGAWAELENGLEDLVPFKGYAISNKSNSGIKYTFKGKLVGNGNGTMNFVPGFNLFANSYTAPINIQTLLNGLTDDVKATIYMFDNDRLRSVSKADFAGFRTPKFTVIPSLQAFFVLMDDGTSASESINYAEAVFNNSLGNRGLYAPKRQETPEFNRVRINIAAENGANDEVYLIEAADYTNDFENGYDEAKFMNNGLNIFATTAYGRQATTITNDIDGTFVGVQGNGTYTLTFDELVGEEYQIRDLQNGVVIAMTEDNTYTFTANGAEEARFVVEKIAKMPTAINNAADAKMFVSNNTLYVSANDADIQIFAANGQLVIAEKAQATVDLSGLAAGVYTVRVANQTLKFVK